MQKSLQKSGIWRQTPLKGPAHLQPKAAGLLNLAEMPLTKMEFHIIVNELALLHEQ
ncbi:MAG: hypothetical protein HY360_02340 [Verrucomicrobia bacterium]|nr:hypothetical protein [Verrucomicrobiota bacterium]